MVIFIDSPLSAHGTYQSNTRTIFIDKQHNPNLCILKNSTTCSLNVIYKCQRKQVIFLHKQEKLLQNN